MRSRWIPALLLGAWVLAAPAGARAATTQPAVPVYAYQLPFKGDAARYFFVHRGSLHLGDHATKAIYRMNARHELSPIASAAGWHVADATAFRSRIVYCSRNRVFFKTRTKTRTETVIGAKDLVALCSDGSRLYTLDAAKREIVVLSSTYRIVRRMPCPGRRLRDLVHHDDRLWVLDVGDRCVRQLNKSDGTVSLRFQTALQGSSSGIVFIGDDLYVHDRDASSLRLLRWRRAAPATLSAGRLVELEVVHETRGRAGPSRSTVRFAVPPATPYQQVRSLTWSPQPDATITGGDAQQLASFVNPDAPPGKALRLAYRLRMTLSAVQYDLAELPLAALSKLPAGIRDPYLRAERILNMDDPEIQAAARAARKGRDGRPPGGVRSMIENIAEYIMDKLTYRMDGSWNRPAVILRKGEGSCSEYAFVFSALCRLNGVPTRLVSGVGLETAGRIDRFHRWTEVWYPGTGWVPVDVSRMDSDDPLSRDYEYLFGLPGHLVVLSRVGRIDHKALGLNYAVSATYTGPHGRGTTYLLNHTQSDPRQHPVVVVTLKDQPAKR